ncbi:FAD-dependent monooxygenase [Nonomuraea basaltis]|uniref:FAD-dependent monooxygenase n=1 Tax=Nonomuraea basaltis TaxID=2495887 RepID=UPI00110C6795|nr:FAD-dependent monooxygenase [Nonomuraea basaltis]TMR93766.1 FAD-binding protein [Nonomuraea basaltis]
MKPTLSTDVIVVGAGPTGLMLACELALAGVRCRVLERRADEPNITRAFALHARTLELLDARGLADDVVPRGVQIHVVAPLPGVSVDLRELDSRYPMVLIVPQSGTEMVLQARAEQLGVVIWPRTSEGVFSASTVG